MKSGNISVAIYSSDQQTQGERFRAGRSEVMRTWTRAAAAGQQRKGWPLYQVRREDGRLRECCGGGGEGRLNHEREPIFKIRFPQGPGKQYE